MYTCVSMFITRHSTHTNTYKSTAKNGSNFLLSAKVMKIWRRKKKKKFAEILRHKIDCVWACLQSTVYIKCIYVCSVFGMVALCAWLFMMSGINLTSIYLQVSYLHSHISYSWCISQLIFSEMQHQNRSHMNICMNNIFPLFCQLWALHFVMCYVHSPLYF